MNKQELIDYNKLEKETFDNLDKKKYKELKKFWDIHLMKKIKDF